MNSKMIGRMGINCVMTALLLLLMARQITGNTAHEWLGTGMFVLWIAHHIFNFRWYAHLFHGRYTPFRILQVVVNILLLLSMIGTMVSAMVLSREVFAFLPISGGIALARSAHVFCAFWGFVLMALHLGLHWSRILGMLQKRFPIVWSKKIHAVFGVMAVGMAVYGIYAFLNNQIYAYLFSFSSFVFFDFERPSVFFFTEYLGMMGLFVFLAHYGGKGLQRLADGKKNMGKRES